MTCRKAANDAYYAANADRIRREKSAYNASRRERNAELAAARRATLRAQVIEVYGGRCACCGEDRQPFLTVDHADGGGSRHRREINGNSKRTAGTYEWLRRQGFPPGFQILCWNCNCGRQLNGGLCPHQEVRRADALA